MKKILVAMVLTVLTIVAMTGCGTDERAEVVTVVSSANGIVTVESADGNLWECYGDTEEIVLLGVFQNDELVDLMTINEKTDVKVLDVINGINYKFIVKNENLDIVSRTQNIDEYANETVKSVKIIDDSEEFGICIFI